MVLPLIFTVYVRGDGQETKIRWDLINVDPNFTTISAGGSASAIADDGSKITLLTGSGTFNPGDPEDVTGGGNWKTFDSNGATTGSGKYEVKGLVRWVSAPGTFPLPNDDIGNPVDFRAGLVVLRISYKDGESGILVVSCNPGNGTTPAAVFEGITASKGFVDYWNRELAQDSPFVNGDRTIFHVVPKTQD
jgi:hypothetical protein